MNIKKYAGTFLATLFILSLSGCGPKEVGQSTIDAPPHERNLMDDARYPMDKNKLGGDYIQEKLYIMNKPSYMINLEKQQEMYFQNRMGRSEKDEAERRRPKQASPFKEY